MKLLTLNTHSLEEENMEEKQKQFVEAVLALEPDVIALQEVNQTMASGVVKNPPAELVMVQETVPLREDNHALKVFELLKQAGVTYNFAWLPAKIGYSKYDEGMAVLTRKPILQADSLLLSSKDDYSDYRTRKALSVFTEDGRFVSVHMGWWKDEKEPFKPQWEKLKELVGVDGTIFLMGDFNADASIRDEGYDLVKSDGWHDLYEEAEVKDDGNTVTKVIDGWRDQQAPEKMRIDFIFSSKPVKTKKMRTAFNGTDEAVISDHYGLFAEIED